MARSIGARGGIVAGKRSIARRQIATRTVDTSAYTETFPTGSWTFTAPRSGFYKFVGWGRGGADVASAGGASGGYGEITRRFNKGQTAAVAVGGLNAVVDTTVTFPDSTVATAGRANGAVPGTATGWDVNLNGSAPGAAGLGTGGGASTGSSPGGGAPANLPFRGGAGADSAAGAGHSPGGGAAVSSTLPGGEGQVLVIFIRE